MNRQNGGASLLADTLESILNHGAGPRNISYDMLRRRLQDDAGMGLDEALGFIRRHEATALDILKDDRGWTIVKYTAAFAVLRYEVPDNEASIRRCIAGIGKGASAVGLHFAIDENDWLFVYARDHGARVWRGKRRAEMGALRTAVEANLLSVEGLRVAERSAMEPGIGEQAYKRALKRLTAGEA